MSNTIIKIPAPISGGLLLSYKCNAACRHCMYACSTKWKADWIEEDNLKIILNQLAGRIQPSPYGPSNMSLNHGLHFTGGEPFLNFNLLCKAIEISSELNIPSVFVETNCFWCTEDKTTREKLLLLREKGLKGIMISVNPFYLEYVPFEKTERAIKISAEIFSNYLMVYQLDYYRRFKSLGIKDKVSFDKYLELENKTDFARNTEFFIMGRAPYSLKNELENIYPKYPAKSFFKVPCMPAFLRSWHNHFDNYGNYIPGYCGGISLGNCRELDNLLNNGIILDQFPVLKYLVNNDISGLLQFSKEYGYVENTAGYYSKCHLCLDLRKYLVTKNDFKELQPKEFYAHLD